MDSPRPDTFSGEAVQHARKDKPDVILMDIQMPGMDGLEAIRRIRADANLTKIPIIALTALAMPGDRDRCMAAGADVIPPDRTTRFTALAPPASP